jgi:hypothetical protein
MAMVPSRDRGSTEEFLLTRGGFGYHATFSGIRSGTEVRVRASRILTLLAAMAIASILGGCFSREHPDHDRYEYLYIDGVFQPPYKAFPTGVDRGNWKCYDGKVNREYDCTFVRGGWGFYQYIYRRR